MKRIFDIVVASITLVLALPILAIAALAVRLTSQGPAFFAHERCGYRKVPFHCLKLRTMVPDAQNWLARDPSLRAKYRENGFKLQLKEDPRVTNVGRFLRLFTDLPPGEVARLEALDGVEINDAKKILADNATKLCHGVEAAQDARRTAEMTFEEGQAASGLPTVEIPQGELDAGIPAFELLKRAGLCATNSEARRLINGGGGRLNDEPIADETRPVNTNDLNADGVIKLSAGKKRHALVRAV